MPYPVRRGAFRAAVAATALILAGCAKPSDDTAPDTTVYSGGDILTMVGAEPAYAEALAVRGGKILAVGTRDEVTKAAGAEATQVNLAGRTLLPGFIDGHSHLLNYADSLVQANLNPPPIGGVRSIPDIIEALRKLKTDLKAGKGDVLIGQGYDQDMLAEKRHPTAADLDAAFPDNPVLVVHASGHMLVANSLAFKAANIDASTPDPEGGTILRKPGGREPLGLVQEMGMYPFQSMLKGARKPEVDLDLIRRAVAHYAANGYTTASEALVMSDKMPVIEAAADADAFVIDVIALPAFTMATELVGTGKLRLEDCGRRLSAGQDGVFDGALSDPRAGLQDRLPRLRQPHTGADESAVPADLQERCADVLALQRGCGRRHDDRGPRVRRETTGDAREGPADGDRAFADHPQGSA